MEQFKPFRMDAVDKATGQARFGADYQMHGLVYAKTLYPPVPCSKIIKIDTSLAEKAEGVVRVFTRADIHGTNAVAMIGDFYRPAMVGEGEIARFQGDAIALVAADTEDHAARAVELIRVDYEPLPVAHTVEEAIEMGLAPCAVSHTEQGDVEEAFRNAAVTVERDFDFPLQEHAYMEPEGGVAFVEDYDTIAVCVGTQNLLANERCICAALGLPASRLRLVSTYVGGAFGGKHNISVQIYLALMADILRRPVKLTWTREESIRFSCKKQGTRGHAKIALDAEGRILALEANAVGPSAPYIGNSKDDLGGVLHGMLGPYKIPNYRLDGKMYETSIPELGAFRSVGADDGVSVGEALVTLAGAKLGLDQREIRRRNWTLTNEDFYTFQKGSVMRNLSPRWPMEEVVDMALKLSGDLPKPSGAGKTVGRGIAIAKPAFATGNALWHSWGVAQLDLHEDGSLVIRSGFCELGQGLSGIIPRVASDALGIPEERISIIMGDSRLAQKSGAQGFSQATVNIGKAIIEAAGELKTQLIGIARDCLKQPDADLTFCGDRFVNKAGETVLTWEELRPHLFAYSLPISVIGREKPYPVGDSQYGVTPVACVCDVEVDGETGEVKILNIAQAHDTGKVLSYESARGQMIGGALMGIGNTVMEAFLMRDGKCLTPSFAEYLIPTAMDMPERNQAAFLEDNPGESLPEGAKGLGEHGIYCIGAAIHNAIFDATGLSIMEKPITPERVLRAMGKLPQTED